MIYRIHHDDNFLAFEIPTREVLNRLGREYPFHINRAPIAYAPVWQEPFEILFCPPEEKTQDIVPDMSEVDGKLFLSERAFDILKDILNDNGEFLPITHKGGKGYIFNILTIAEDQRGLDEKLTAYDVNGNLENFGFVQNIMGQIPMFRTELDGYQGIFCNEAVRELIENNRLTGIFCHDDLSNPLGESYGTAH